jgi:predicted DsbA family dithiol-disulfide isomerase
VSDVSCPWCIIGLLGLEEALTRIGDAVDAAIHSQPFELNPNMPPEGQNITTPSTRTVRHRAEQEGRHAALKHALFEAYFMRGDNGFR